MRKKCLAVFFTIFLLADIALAAKPTINLPPPKTNGAISIEEAIAKRRSERSFYPNNLSLEQISQLLWAGQGITEKTWGFRTVPSAGALYPLTLYIVKSDGIFQYFPDSHKLGKISGEDRRPSLVRASLGQNYIGEAPLVIVIAGNFRITEAKYGQRAYRYINMEVGHAAENILLQAVAMGMAGIPIGTFWDDVVAKVLELPDTQDPYYIIPIGYFKPVTS